MHLGAGVLDQSEPIIRTTLDRLLEAMHVQRLPGGVQRAELRRLLNDLSQPVEQGFLRDVHNEDSAK